MNNKLRQGLIISTIVTLGLLGQVKEAIAQTLNDKNIDKTEELARVTDNTASAINMNFDLDRSSPDASAVKQFFMGWDILTEEEKGEFDMLWNKAMHSNVRQYYEEEILRIFWQRVEDVEKIVLVSAILDPTWQTKLGKHVFEEISKSEYYQIRIKQIRNIMKIRQQLEELDKRNEELDKGNEESQERIKNLDDIIEDLDSVIEIFEKKSK